MQALNRHQHIGHAHAGSSRTRAPASFLCQGGSILGLAGSSSSDDTPASQKKKPIQPTSMLDLQYESDRLKGSVVKSQAPRRAPISSGVKTATQRFELPAPSVAVRNLTELARYGHLCTTMSGMHHRRAGFPFGTLVDFAVDGAGHPVFCLSPLSIHSRNLLEDPRASMVVQMPGWTGLDNARVTIFGEIHQLSPELQDPACDIFFAKHSSERTERWLSGNFLYFRMDRIVDIYFVGGFGTVQWIDPAEYLNSPPDAVVLDSPTRTLQMLGDEFGAGVLEFISPVVLKPGQSISELVFISIDANGVDVRVRVGPEFHVERVNFGRKVNSAAEAVEALTQVLAAHKQKS